MIDEGEGRNEGEREGRGRGDRWNKRSLMGYKISFSHRRPTPSWTVGPIIC